MVLSVLTAVLLRALLASPLYVPISTSKFAGMNHLEKSPDLDLSLSLAYTTDTTENFPF